MHGLTQERVQIISGILEYILLGVDFKVGVFCLPRHCNRYQPYASIG